MNGKIENLLGGTGVAYDIIQIGPYGLRLGEDDDEIRSLLEKESSLLKVLLLENTKQKYLGAIIPSNKELDIGKVERLPQIRGLFTDYQFTPADPETVNSITGCEADRISPFTFYFHRIPALFENGLDNERCISGLNGDASEAVRFYSHELLKLKNYIPCNICKVGGQRKF